MTNNEILKADLLDILFEHRNKSYGAYVLRRYYNNRLMLALAISLSAVILISMCVFLKKNVKQYVDLPGSNLEGKEVVVKEIEIKKEEQKSIQKSTPVSQRDFRTIKIVKDVPLDKPIVEQNDLIKAAISTIDVDGPIPEEPSKTVTSTVTETGTGNEKPEKQAKGFIPEEKSPSFPGGPEALALFFSRTLSSPTDLEAGEKKIILVRFVVGADGSITKAEIVQSGGDEYDREVLRAFKRMPKWNPAIQNGIKVATTFTQPVTFMGVE